MSLFDYKNSNKKQRTSFIAGLAIAIFGLLSLSGFAVHKVSAYATDCSSNSIMTCGYLGPTNFIDKVTRNDDGHGHHDMQSIYSYYGLNPGDYQRFINTARPGVAYKDGRIVVDGQVVATGGASIGREASPQGSNYFTQPIAGTNYYGNTNAKAFGSDALPIYAIFDAKGKLQFSVLQSCGNPEYGVPVTPTYSCNMLHSAQVNATTYDFATDASAGSNASIAKCVYDFGDGVTVTQTNCAATVQHTYAKGGNFTAKVTVYVNLPGGQQTTIAAAGQCLKQITIAVPYYQCVQLAGAIIDQSKFSYSFVATAKYGNGAQLISADFNFGDGKSTNGVKPDKNGTTLTTSHAYAQAGNYNASAILHFTANGQNVTAPTCKALVTPTTPPTPECKPGVPTGSAECTPCQYDSTLPSNSPQCLPPVLPNTGAGNVIAIFAAVFVGGFLIYRQLLFRKHKAAFNAADNGMSPLPLADPLSTSVEALKGTPIGKRVSKSLRRNRPF